MDSGLVLDSSRSIGDLAIARGLPIVLYLQHERRKREMEHTERMKALELGRTFPARPGAVAGLP